MPAASAAPFHLIELHFVPASAGIALKVALLHRYKRALRSTGRSDSRSGAFAPRFLN
jgi:hypothetical protein